MKMLAATMPTNPAAIHSMVSMKRSIDARFMFAPTRPAIAGKTRRQDDPAALPRCNRFLLCQGVVFGKRGAQLDHGGVRIDAVFLDGFGPGLDQRVGCFLPEHQLLRCQLVDFVIGQRPDLVDTGVFELAPWFADAAGSLGIAVVVD